MRAPTILMVGACVATGLALFGCASPKTLKAERLRTVFSGNTIYMTNRDGSEQMAYLRPEGTAIVVAKGGGEGREATWRIVGDTLCHDFRSVRKCYRIWDMTAYYRAQSIDLHWQPRYAVKKGRAESFPTN